LNFLFERALTLRICEARWSRTLRCSIPKRGQKYFRFAESVCLQLYIFTPYLPP